MPNKLEVTAGRVLRLGSEVKISIPKDLTKRKAIVGYLEGRLSDNNIRTTATTAKKAQLLLVVDNTLQDEAYELTVTPKRAVIKSNSQGAGFFYGVQSFMQLVPADADADAAVQCVEIKDAPRFQYRGAMIDVARNFQSKQTVLRFIDLMAAFKMNRLHIHLTDDQGWRIEIKRYPRLTEVGSKRSQTMIGHSDYYYPRRFDGKPQEGFYTQQDIKEMVAYAADRFITIIPEIEMPGHSSAALAAYPQYSCGLGKQYVVRDYMDIFDEVYCPQEQTFEFLQNVLTEVMDLFPSEYIHIGGDECPKKAWKVCPRCQALIKKLNLKDEHELQSWFVHRIERFVNSKGKSIIGWDEILEGGLAPNATVMSWRGEVGGIEAAKMKHKVIMTPGDYCYIDRYQDAPITQPTAMGGYLTLKKMYDYVPGDDLTADERRHITGLQANLWAEYIPSDEQMEYMFWPRAMAIAEIGWNGAEKKDYADFHRRALAECDTVRAMGIHAFDLRNEIGERKESFTPVKHKARGCRVTYNTPLHPKYTAGGEQALVDGVRGGWTYADKKWQGFTGTEGWCLDVTIDMGSIQKLHEVSAVFMQSLGPWIYYPTKYRVSLSEDGKTFTQVYSQDQPQRDPCRVGYRTQAWHGSRKARYVRVQGSCDTEFGWLFTDEIVVR